MASSKKSWKTVAVFAVKTPLKGFKTWAVGL